MAGRRNQVRKQYVHNMLETQKLEKNSTSMHLDLRN